MDLVEKIARLISEADRAEADEAPDFADWHWEERADLAREIIAAIEGQRRADQKAADAGTIKVFPGDLVPSGWSLIEAKIVGGEIVQVTCRKD